MTTILHSLTRIGATQMGMAARFSTTFVDAIDRVVEVQMEAANSAFHENAKSSQELLGHDMLASPAEWQNWYAQWLRTMATNNSRLTQDTARKLYDAALRTQTEFHQITADQIEVLTKGAKDGIERFRDEGATLLADMVPENRSVAQRRESEGASGTERPAKKAA